MKLAWGLVVLARTTRTLRVPSARVAAAIGCSLMLGRCLRRGVETTTTPLRPRL
ncbi:hypothetical protein PF010_g31856 [Phytophthora fragariae]|uniref:Uncharacterized protein n=1 Tax=Phytophthora fragariae TaxID=53985 RepID=A0A6A3QM09_9STRA|nr:hypothetical protein PF010_g31856 [Phytophthora fragariae]KAE9079081.1 hypothetical protein PF006_g27591 [Phytophthora fragariae]KAE9272330.1 hypothetical protein PF001_g27992 [Phytophthora fragariae]